MEIVKTTGEHTIFKKRSGRYGVKLKTGAWVHGEDKVKVLLAEGLIKQSTPKAKDEAAGSE